MAEKENTKMCKFKNRLVKLQEKIHDKVENLQESMHARIEKSKQKLVSHSHIVENKSPSNSCPEERSEQTFEDVENDECEEEHEEEDNAKSTATPIIPSVVIDGPEIELEGIDDKDLCALFINKEKQCVAYKRLSRSTSDLTNLTEDTNLDSSASSESCFSTLSSSDERSVRERPRSGSLPPVSYPDLPTTLQTCTDIIEKIGNKFPRLKNKGDRLQRVFSFNTDLVVASLTGPGAAGEHGASVLLRRQMFVFYFESFFVAHFVYFSDPRLSSTIGHRPCPKKRIPWIDYISLFHGPANYTLFLLLQFNGFYPSIQAYCRYLLKNTRLSDVNKRLKAQIWSSVVTIVLVEAKNLPAMDMESRTSDPYCKFRLGNEKYKSKVVWKSLHPSWLEQFDLHLYDDQEQVLEVTVWDKDKQTKDDFLGRCAIDLSRLEREKTHSIWQDLEDGNGQIFLLLTISGTTQSETITDLTSYRENPRDLEIIERRYTWYRPNETSSGVGWLCVKVYGARGLAAADLGGKSDPFCVLELGNARLQTHTEYKTLTPSWMKIFTFTVKDISSILEITVYDEDHDHKVEFLGKLAMPLLNIKNGEKRWYALKDKKMRTRAKGNYPQILLEMMVVWNPLKAAIRVINPKEPKYMHQEAKFKRQLFIRNVMRLKAIIMWFIEIGKILQDCFEWESRLRSFLGLLAWLAFCYYYQMWMLPFLILLLFSRNWLIYRFTGGNPLLAPVDDDDLLAEEDDEEAEADKEEKKTLKERLQAIQEVTQTVQNAIGYVASLGEAVKNLMNFTVPYLSYIAIIMLISAMFVLYLIPLRYLLMAWGVNKFTRKILRPHTIPNNEVLDLLSRVPDDEILPDFLSALSPQTRRGRVCKAVSSGLQGTEAACAERTKRCQEETQSVVTQWVVVEATHEKIRITAFAQERITCGLNLKICIRIAIDVRADTFDDFSCRAH
ncbi:Multiple C2 and transmembrane domain-containing protein [Eumeta japonica]|uniref:Multiple C2 and transmembrane domain-containing protein n=1 Tax=Eumeta variegata TaxID=151549 RepID=A0A4C1TCF6_EUMVA|nr:Multiple C2 and transmembrane domain-containing protein [Eumeta japonica]